MSNLSVGYYLSTLEYAAAEQQAEDVEFVDMARPARAADRSLFRVLWREFLQENVGNGSVMAPTDRSLDFVCSMFDKVVSGEWRGAALIDERGAALLWPAPPSPFDYSFAVDSPDRVAVGYGTYLRPALRGHGYGARLQRMGGETARESGCLFFMGAVPSHNSASKHLGKRWGVRDLETAVLIPLDKALDTGYGGERE